MTDNKRAEMINTKKIAERITDTHIYFWSGIFSQWYSSKFQIKEEGILYENAEQYMMFKKALLFDDIETASEILKTKDPRVIKDLGREVKNFNEARWDAAKVGIVREGNYLKFSQNKLFKKILIKYKDHILVEASPYDKIWGIGLSPEDERVLDQNNWRGQNLLGICIMEARAKILKEEEILN